MSADDNDFEVGAAFMAPPDPDVSPSLLRQIAERSPNAIIVAATTDFRILYANRAAHDAVGHPAGSLMGRIATDAFPFVDPAMMVTRTPAQTRVAVGGADAPAWWEVSYAPLDEAEAGISSVLITAVDMTRQLIANQGPRTAHDTLDALLAYIPEGITIAYGPEVHVERISARGLALLGRDAREVTGRSAVKQTDVWDVYRPGDDVPLPPAERPLARATRTGEVTLNETLIVRRSDGSLLNLLCNSGPIRDADGRVTGAVMAWRDVGELQRARAAMRDSEERLRAVLLQIPATVFIVEPPDGRMTFKSRILDEVLGHPDEDMTTARTSMRGWAVHKDGTPYDLSEYPSRRALFKGETVQAEPMSFLRGDGRLIDLEMYAGPVHSDTGEIIAAVAVAMDVTERRQAEARQAFLFDLQDALRALSEPKEILTTAATLLGRHLGAGRIGYSEIQSDDHTIVITNGYVDGADPVNGVFSIGMFGPRTEALLRQGRTIVYEDLQADDGDPRDVGLEFGTRAHVSVPLIRDGRYTGSLYVTHFKPYTWRPADIALIEDVAARIWDAAERGRAETKLRESEARLRLVMESTGLGFWEFDAITRKTIRSARHDEIFGYDAPIGDWSYEQFRAHIPEVDRDRVEAGFRAAVEQGKDWDVECGLVRADGTHGWIQVRARPHRDVDGKIVRLIGTVADVTERKQAEIAVIETAERFENFAQTMPSMVWTSLPDGRIDWFNNRVPEYAGMSAEDMKPDGWAPVHPDDIESATTRWREALETGNPYATEYRIRRHDGMFRWHVTRAIPIRDPDGAIIYWIGTSADIHDQKSSEQALADLNATLENQVRERTAELLAAEATLRQSQKMEAVGQLTGGLAHDFNNLLTGIIGSLELISSRVDQGKVGELGRYLAIAQGSAQRAAALTHRLLAFSRRQTLDPKPTDVNQLVRGMDDLIRRTVTPAVTVELACACDAWAVRADQNQLENALLNLCINARDAMPDGGSLIIETQNTVLDEPEASTLELPVAEYVLLSVRDTGAGMTAEVLANAFDPFFTTKPIGEGTGLGLSMVYGFARQSGGQARIESEPGRGTTVCLYLPRYVGEGSVVEPAAGARKTQRGDGKTVLVVDDESSVRLLVREVLDDLGYDVLEAETGSAALQILDSNRPVDLLVTDVGLPGGMNGRQLADAALFRRATLKILFITGYADGAAISDGSLKDGMHILTKPFSLDTLGEKVSRIIETT